jgi:hypothetical protein
MRRLSIFAIFCALSAMPGFAAGKGPEVDLVDNKLSINADTIALGRLMRLVDLATGMKSKVPPELANRNVSVRFSGLNISDGVRKIFEGQPIDYFVVPGQGVIVTASSQSLNGTESVPVYNSPGQQPFEPPQDFQTGIQGQVQPATIQTPFGPVANPRAQPQQPNAALAAPGQNTLFPGTIQQNPLNQNQPQPQNPFAPNGPTVGIQPTTTPFGTPSPFATPTQPQPQGQPAPNNQNNNLFANPFNNGTQPRTP